MVVCFIKQICAATSFLSVLIWLECTEYNTVVLRILYSSQHNQAVMQ